MTENKNLLFMTNTFNRILVPVDFSVNTSVAIKKAMDIAEDNTLIHLLHAYDLVPIGFGTGQYRYMEHMYMEADVGLIKERFKQWKQTIESLNKKVTVKTWLRLCDAVQNSIIQLCNEVQPDLVIIGKKSHHTWLPFLNTVKPSYVADKTGIPVLTVKPGSLEGETKTIIVPVVGELQAKVEMIEQLARKNTITIRLVDFLDNQNTTESQIATLKLVSDGFAAHLECMVQYSLLKGNNHAKLLLEYAENEHADLLLVSSSQTKVNWMNCRISDEIYPDSALQLLAV